MQEDLINVAYHLLKAYILPSKAYDVLEDLAIQHIRMSGSLLLTPQVKVSAINAVATALHEAQKKIDEECRAKTPAMLVDLAELEEAL